MNHFCKHKIVCLLFIFAIIISTCVVPVFARSSPTLSHYRADCTAASGGRIDITVLVTGVDTMDKIGVDTIYLYESTDDVSFRLVKIFYASAWPAMMETNDYSYYNTPVYYNGTPGRYYLANVYVYAELNGVSDTKKYETASVRAIS